MSPSTRLNTPQPASSIPTCTRHGGASSPRCHARTSMTIAAETRNHVATWKKPSASVFASSPSTVSGGLPSVPVSRWCHWRPARLRSPDVTQRSEFDAEEWETLRMAPALAAAAVSAATPGGSVRETIALARMYAEARTSGALSDLVTAIVDPPPRLGRDQIAATDAAELLDHAAGLVTAASDLLRERATERELREFGDFVVHLTQAVAAAHKEGGILGIGGTPVSEAEHAATERIAYALGPRPGTSSP